MRNTRNLLAWLCLVIASTPSALLNNTPSLSQAGSISVRSIVHIAGAAAVAVVVAGRRSCTHIAGHSGSMIEDGARTIGRGLGHADEEIRTLGKAGLHTNEGIDGLNRGIRYTETTIPYTDLTRAGCKTGKFMKEH